MNADGSTTSRVYRVGVHLIAVIGTAATLFSALGACIAVKKGDWTFIAVVVGAAALLFLLLTVLRLEIGQDALKYRNLSGSREIAFTDVNRAYVKVVRAKNAPQGVASFWIERRDGGPVKINLRTFPIQGAAALFTALETHGIQIEVPDLWAARRMVEQVRAAQAKMRERGSPTT